MFEVTYDPTANGGAGGATWTDRSYNLEDLPITGFVFLALANSMVTSDPARQGSVEAHVKIFPLSEVNLADDANAAKAETAQPYSEYPLIIRSRGGEKEIARVTLPPGDYVLDVEGRAQKRVRATPRPFTVVANQTVRVDMDIDRGIR